MLQSISCVYLSIHFITFFIFVFFLINSHCVCLSRVITHTVYFFICVSMSVLFSFHILAQICTFSVPSRIPPACIESYTIIYFLYPFLSLTESTRITFHFISNLYIARLHSDFSTYILFYRLILQVILQKSCES